MSWLGSGARSSVCVGLADKFEVSVSRTIIAVVFAGTTED